MTDYQDNLVSIITPVYNAEDFIGDTIKSILAQTYPIWELWLIDDCSTDGSYAICSKFSENDSRIKLRQLSQNSGAAIARNTGLELAQGRYIAFLDSDDLWHPEKLARQLEFMKVHQYSFTYTSLALISQAGQMIKEKVDIPLSLTYTDLLKNTAIACSTVVIDRDKIGDFKMPNVRKGQDTATWLMLLRGNNLSAYGLNEVLNYYRQVEGSISSNRWGALKRTWHTYRELERLPLPSAIYFFIHYIFNAILRRI